LGWDAPIYVSHRKLNREDCFLRIPTITRDKDNGEKQKIAQLGL